MPSNRHPIFFDPFDEFQKEEFLSGRWTLKPDELKELYNNVTDLDNFVTVREYNDAVDVGERAGGKLEDITNEIKTLCEDAGDDVEALEELIKDVNKVCEDAV